MPHPLEQVANNFMQMAQTRFGINMQDEMMQKQIAQAGSMAAYITGTVMPAEAGDKPVKPHDALKMTVGHANKIGFDPVRALELYAQTKALAEKSSQANNGMGIMEYLKAQKLVGDIAKGEQDIEQGNVSMEGQKQGMFLKSPAGIAQTARAESGAPKVRSILSGLRSRMADVVAQNPAATIENKVDALAEAYGGLEGWFGRNKTKDIPTTASAIAKDIITNNPEITEHYDEAEIADYIKKILVNPKADIDLIGGAQTHPLERAFGALGD